MVSEVNLVENNAEWIVDIGTSKHFYTNREIFTEFESVVKGEQVYMDNSSSLKVFGKRKIFSQTYFWQNISIK